MGDQIVPRAMATSRSRSVGLSEQVSDQAQLGRDSAMLATALGGTRRPCAIAG
jgi:hypothetical protein